MQALVHTLFAETVKMSTPSTTKPKADPVDPKKMTRILENAPGLRKILKPYINTHSEDDNFGMTHYRSYIYRGKKTPFIPSSMYTTEDLTNIMMLLVTIKSVGEHIKIAHVSIGASADLAEDRARALSALVSRVNTYRGDDKPIKNPPHYDTINILKVPFLISIREKGVTDEENKCPQVLDLMTAKKHEICIAQHQWIPVDLDIIKSLSDDLKSRKYSPDAVVEMLRDSLTLTPVVRQSAAAGGGA
jgi:hypothetical protein